MNNVDETAVEELSNQIKFNTKLTEIDVEMDIGSESIVAFEQMTRTSFFDSTTECRDSATAIKTNLYYETPINSMNQILKSDWLVESFQHPVMNDLNSERDLDSLPFLQKPMPAQSNTFEAHLYDPGELSGDEFDFSDDASETPDEPIIRRQKASNVIESSDDDNDAMY
jgi:hypothetical protein